MRVSRLLIKEAIEALHAFFAFRGLQLNTDKTIVNCDVLLYQKAPSLSYQYNGGRCKNARYS